MIVVSAGLRSPSTALRTVRFALEPTDVVPVSFEWTFDAAVPPALEQREQHRSPDGYRLDADIVRYHQIGVARGWVELDGTRSEFDEDTWVSTRDHSWGVRYMVGVPPTDVATRDVPSEVGTLVLWMPKSYMVLAVIAYLALNG